MRKPDLPTIIAFIFIISVISILFSPLIQSHLPSMRMIVTPDGYPIEGKTWTVNVYSLSNSQEYVVLENATISMQTTNAGTFAKSTDKNGQATFDYLPEMGKVTFVANHTIYGNIEWAPQKRFVSSEIAAISTSAFSISTISSFWQLTKKKREQIIDKLLFYVLVFLVILGWVLSSIWVLSWGFGSQWGYSDQIFSIGNFPITSQFLLLLSIITAALAVASTLRNIFNKETNRNEKKIDQPRLEYVS
jgi:hypothetical protein